MFAMEYKKIGIKVLASRRLKGFTKKKLSELSGVSRPRISDIERGKGPYNIESLMLICKALEIDMQTLFKDD